MSKDGLPKWHASVRDIGDAVLNPGLGRSPGGGSDNRLLSSLPALSLIPGAGTALGAGGAAGAARSSALPAGAAAAPRSLRSG